MITTTNSPSLRNIGLADKTVYEMSRMGYSTTEIIERLVREKHGLSERIIELEQIAPKKTQLPNGSIAIWRCPDNLIPFTN